MSVYNWEYKGRFGSEWVENSTKIDNPNQKSQKGGERNMASFVGSHTRQLDERGRFVLPSKIREKIEGEVHITRSLVDDCLLLYTDDEWKILEEQVRELPTTTNKAAKRFVQIVFGQAVSGEVDKQGRIVLTKELLDAVGMTRDIVLVGIGSKVELWDADKYAKTMAEADFTEILDGISQFGLNI